MKSISIYVSNDLVTDQRMRRFADTLHGMGWKVTLIGRHKKKSKPKPALSFNIQRVNTVFEKGILFYAMINLIFFCKASFSGSKVLWSVDLDTLPAIRLAAWVRNKILVWDCHEIFPYMPELYTRPIKQRLWRAIEKFFIPGLKYVVAVNSGVARYLSESYGVYPSIVHNYPYTMVEYSSPAFKLKSDMILFQGAINDGRCLDVLIRSMQYISPPMHLTIAGDGPLKKELEFLSSAMGLSHRIKFTGELTPDQLKKLTDGARIGISLLNVEHRNSWISLANKNLDYIMAGLPAITVDFPEYRAINKRWPVAILLPEVIEKTISEAVNQLYINKDLYREMVQNCLEARKSLCWENEVGAFHKFMGTLPI